MLGVNPENDKQRRVFFCGWSANNVGEKRHPQIVMAELAKKYNFKILACVPQSIADGWDFWIESDEIMDLPDYLCDFIWKPVGKV